MSNFLIAQIIFLICTFLSSIYRDVNGAFHSLFKPKIAL